MNYNNNKINIINNNNNKITIITPTPPPAAAAAATNNSIIRSNGTQACAACKYQRRKCAPDCILAPYFPHHRQRQFLNAHKLFGVSNITKIIRSLDQHEKDQAMRTIIYQSDVRANDPVGGCYRIIRDLQRQIEFNRAELELVLHQLAYCRAQNQLNNVNVLPSNDSGSFDIVTNNHNDNVQQYYHDGDDQIQRTDDQDQDQEQYILHGDDQIHRPDDQDQDQEQYILHGDDQIHRPDDQDQDQDQEQYILHGNECDQVHFEEINSWEATGSSATLEAKKSYDCAENWQEDINAKQLSEEQREVLKFEAEEKSFDSVNNFRLKSTPAN